VNFWRNLLALFFQEEVNEIHLETDS